ncbi:MAG: Hpt domain-containing protein [Lachnospiraceae bacterium]|nr:Hpt domain-containing protein [Lachnospiraceae bacterium]
MGYDLSVLTAAGLDIKAGLGYTGGEDKYVSAVQRFYKNHEKNVARIEELLMAEDYENYMITVHALKSNSKMIGAATLGSMFEELENAARNRDTGVIDSIGPIAMQLYDTLIENLKPVGEMGEVRAAGEISAEEARRVAAELLTALDDFDDELSKELVTKLSGYPFRMTQKEKLKEAAAQIDDFLYDEAADIIKEIVPAIE